MSRRRPPAPSRVDLIDTGHRGQCPLYLVTRDQATNQVLESRLLFPARATFASTTPLGTPLVVAFGDGAHDHAGGGRHVVLPSGWPRYGDGADGYQRQRGQGLCVRCVRESPGIAGHGGTAPYVHGERIRLFRKWALSIGRDTTIRYGEVLAEGSSWAFGGLIFIGTRQITQQNGVIQWGSGFQAIPFDAISNVFSCRRTVNIMVLRLEALASRSHSWSALE